MPREPNVIRRRDRKGWWFRAKQDGRIVQKFLSLDHQSAVKKARSLKSETHVKIEPLTVHEAAARWLAVYVPLHRREKDRKKIAQRVRDYLLPQLGRVPLRDLRRRHLEEYRLVLERSHLAPQTIAHVLSDVRCLLNWTMDGQAPIPRRLLPKLQERPPDRLTEEEAEKVTAVPEPYGFIVRLLLSTGIRWGEAVRAMSTEVQDGMLVLANTKSGKVRRVPLSPEIQAELRGRVGKLVRYANAQTVTLKVRELTGIETFHAHQLRHTFGCRWLERGGSLAALQEVMGHSSITVTQRYARLGEAHVRAEAAKVFAMPCNVTRGDTKEREAVQGAVR